MVAALIACTNVISHKCAKKHGVEFETMSISAESTLDRRGTQLIEEIEVPFPKISPCNRRRDKRKRSRY